MKKKVNAGFLSLCALLAAFSIVFGKYLAINIGENFRFSLENLPLLLAGLYLGPLAGAVVGAVADIVGCILVGYAINPIITAGAICIGLISGLVGKCLKAKSFSRVFFAVAFSHLIGSILIKTFGLYVYYGSPFIATAAWRFIVYTCIGFVEFLILFLLSKNSAFVNQISKFIHK